MELDVQMSHSLVSVLIGDVEEEVLALCQYEFGCFHLHLKSTSLKYSRGIGFAFSSEAVFWHTLFFFFLVCDYSSRSNQILSQ